MFVCCIHSLTSTSYGARSDSYSPAVVANLWDVTDKDIDRLTKAAFERFGLGDSPSNVALPLALAEARVACSLKFLNGAAPVVWGIPVKLTA